MEKRREHIEKQEGFGSQQKNIPPLDLARQKSEFVQGKDKIEQSSPKTMGDLVKDLNSTKSIIQKILASNPDWEIIYNRVEELNDAKIKIDSSIALKEQEKKSLSKEQEKLIKEQKILEKDIKVIKEEKDGLLKLKGSVEKLDIAINEESIDLNQSDHAQVFQRLKGMAQHVEEIDVFLKACESNKKVSVANDFSELRIKEQEKLRQVLDKLDIGPHLISNLLEKYQSETSADPLKEEKGVSIASTFRRYAWNIAKSSLYGKWIDMQFQTTEFGICNKEQFEVKKQELQKILDNVQNVQQEVDKKEKSIIPKVLAKQSEIYKKRMLRRLESESKLLKTLFECLDCQKQLGVYKWTSYNKKKVEMLKRQIETRQEQVRLDTYKRVKDAKLPIPQKELGNMLKKYLNPEYSKVGVIKDERLYKRIEAEIPTRVEGVLRSEKDSPHKIQDEEEKDSSIDENTKNLVNLLCNFVDIYASRLKPIIDYSVIVKDIKNYRSKMSDAIRELVKYHISVQGEEINLGEIQGNADQVKSTTTKLSDKAQTIQSIEKKIEKCSNTIAEFSKELEKIKVESNVVENKYKILQSKNPFPKALIKPTQEKRKLEEQIEELNKQMQVHQLPEEALKSLKVKEK